MVLGEELVLGHEAPVTNHVKQPKVKIPLRTIDCSDCAIMVGQVIQDGEIVYPGEPYKVHEGESVKVMPVMTVMEVMALSRLQNAANDVASLESAFSDLCKELSLRIIEWDWTDNYGEAMPQPYQRPDVIARLTTDEVLWLTNALHETADARKNG